MTFAAKMPPARSQESNKIPRRQTEAYMQLDEGDKLVNILKNEQEVTVDLEGKVKELKMSWDSNCGLCVS